MMINGVNNVTQVNNVQNLRKTESSAKVDREYDSISVSAEAKEMAEEKPLRTDAFYGVQFRMSTRSWESKQDNQKREATTIRVVGLEML